MTTICRDGKSQKEAIVTEESVSVLIQPGGGSKRGETLRKEGKKRIRRKGDKIPPFLATRG